ncbi:MAG: dUTPase [Puniceicoccales bacterium]|jgi:dimeric dUTPase (all-alpha-NTP-PPase superfamily)|nr:dUTPase [Puniceicoccales bacterium]
MDKLEKMFTMQAALNKRMGVDVVNLTEQEKINWILNYARAVQQETSELVDSVPWKWWAKYQQFDEQNARVELIDLFHFLIAIAQVLGMSADDVFETYCKKNSINRRRQEDGYAIKDKDDSRGI